MKNKAVFNWSGGKDSALALHKVLQEGEYDVVALLTTIDCNQQKSTMHKIPVPLLHKQAESIGIPLHIENWTFGDPDDKYEDTVYKSATFFKERGVTHFIFGDVFSYDVKSYRKKLFDPYGITVVEPLWDKTSRQVVNEFLDSGLQAVIVTTLADVLNETFIGRHIDRKFVRDYPKGADICGEGGEYHTFCYDGAIFSHPVPYSLGCPYKETRSYKLNDGTLKEFRYWFADLSE